jgi:hypothetical protein
LLLVDHAQFRDLEPGDVAEHMPGRVVVDACGAWNAQAWEAEGYAFFKLGAS